MASTRCVALTSFIFILLGCCSCTFGFNILMSSYYGMGSHFFAGSKVAESLLKKGHNVTFLISEAFSHRAEDPAYSNFSFQIFKHSVPKEEIVDVFSNLIGQHAFESSQVQLKTGLKIVEHNINDCLSILRDKAFMGNIEGIDGIVVDTAWNCGYFIRDFLEMKTNKSRKVPLVAMTPAANLIGSILEDISSTLNRAYQPEFGTGYTNRMTFLQRTMNVLEHWKWRFVSKTVSSWFCEIQKETGQNCHDFDVLEMYAKADIFLFNTHFAVDFPRALTPNVVLVGGLTCRPASPLTQELEDFVQSSGDHGVIIFTLGTYSTSITTIRPELVTMFAEVFRRLPQKVIWQLKKLPDWELPSNVKAMPWLPQNDLLGHPKTRMLMYQGGNNGFQEASYHGVPIVVIPLHSDQPDVAARIEVRGMGKRLDKMSLSADVIYETIEEVIGNPSYTKTAKEVSAIYRNEPMSGPDKAAFWIEHAIKFGGANMRPPVNELNFVQYNLLDVYTFLIGIVIAFVLVILYVLWFCLTICINLVIPGKSTKSKAD
ncbi:UDP-glucuronosyltransferase 2B1-like [Strongylocentrotus purpuratus]|uniref:Glucuronosyltransferase n=1 Tax=Strongylocentrotus purpuratus TaxID=7668 RepID=A0A7M7P2F5_STRPU|nr:UDP-glucuronosyltransferase 2B1-like [Strongylocentrotus purpuratus]